MSIYKELSYDQDIEVVRGIQFSVLSPEEVLRRSVVEVTKTDTYSGSEPVVAGLFDPRMGVLDHHKFCRTCEQKNIFCPGHPGHIHLARPLFHAMFFDIVRKTLRCVCYRCSKILVSPKATSGDLADKVRVIQSKKTGLQKRFDAMYDLCTPSGKPRRCGDDGVAGCGARQPARFHKENILRIVAEWREDKESTKKEFTAEEVLRIFQRISTEDMEALGFSPQWNKPEWMVMTLLAVPPPAMRPSVITDNGQRSEDDLTHKLSDIIKTNNMLKSRIEKGNVTEENLHNLTQLLQYHVATFFDNTLPGLPPAQQRNGRRLKSIADRLKKKEGRIRGNLNGKRVDQSSRSVITPDPYIGMDDLGVPIRIAMNLTFPEEVNQYNLQEMQKLVRAGPDEYPGAKYIRKGNGGRTITLRYADRDKYALELELGDIVDRHMRENDYVLFNRQPSLHRPSMMCHRVRVMPYQTFRLNPTVCAPYNADFDGDECNAHMPQSIQTMGELMDFASVPFHIISAKDGKVIMNLVQDSLLGVYRLSNDTTRIHDKTMANLQMVNSYFNPSLISNANKNKNYEYTGKQAFSAILPPGFSADAGKVVVKNSQLTSGVLDKGAFGAMSRGMIPVIFHDYGPSEARRFLDNTQRLICRWLMSSGFSCGISDLVVDNETVSKVVDIIGKMKGSAYQKIGDVRDGRLDNHSIFNNQDYFEMQILNLLNEATREIGDVAFKTIHDDTNRMINMVKSGSKGKEINVAQMIGCVGQQNVDGKRVPYGFTDRTLPHYTKYDDGPEARGFVGNSFIVGLTPQEVFFHAMGGREGLIDKRLSITGSVKSVILPSTGIRRST